MAIDIEGNTRFYDLLRFKKMAKISSGQVKLGEGVSGPTKFRLMSNVCIEMTQDAFFAVIQGNKIFVNENMKSNETPGIPETSIPVAKGGKNAAPVEDAEPEVRLADTFESEILEDKKFSDSADRFKSLSDIVQ